MAVIEKIIQRVKKNKKTIVLPESMDERVLKAANKIITEPEYRLAKCRKRSFDLLLRQRYHSSSLLFAMALCGPGYKPPRTASKS